MDKEQLTKYSARFLAFTSLTIAFETGGDKSGAYTKVPGDKGGETKWGISKQAHPDLNIKALTFPQALTVYNNDYWNYKYNFINSDYLAFKLFDMGVLSGFKTSVTLLQKAVKECGLTIAIDGHFGPITLAAVNSLDSELLYNRFIAKFDTRFRRLVIKTKTNSKFLNGWLKRLYYKWSTQDEH